MLLDTHIVLAVLGQTDLILPSPVENLLRQTKSQFVSVVTIWEIAIKHRIGKLTLSIELKNLPNLLVDIDIGILPIEPQHTLADIGLEPLTKDPFDRLLLGVCAAEHMKLLTLDRALAAHPLAWREKEGF
jgi:PIN domain nuclease of toxin-antitoxin system